MAVAQQLARVTSEYLAACERAARASPDGDPRWDPPVSDRLDMGWAPAMLERAGVLAGLDRPHLDALTWATEGSESVDVGFLNAYPHAVSPFGPPATALSDGEVARVAALLAQIDPGRLVDGLPDGGEEAKALIGQGAEGLAGDVREFLRGHFADLRRFYEEAARRGLFVVLWWN